MTPVALAALKESIIHWEKSLKRAKREGRHAYIDMTAASCACCRAFRRGGCFDCPIAQHTHSPSCIGTPYYTVLDLMCGTELPSKEELVAAVQEQLNFLKTLLPAEETK